MVKLHVIFLSFLNSINHLVLLQTSRWRCFNQKNVSSSEVVKNCLPPPPPSTFPWERNSGNVISCLAPVSGGRLQHGGAAETKLLHGQRGRARLLELHFLHAGEARHHVPDI